MAKKKFNLPKMGKIKILPDNKLLTALLILMMLVSIAFAVMIILVDALPATLVLILCILLAAGLAGAILLFRSDKKPLRITGVVLAVLFLAIYGLGTSYLSSTYAMFNRISVADSNTRSADGIDLTQDAFNIYITGIDQWSTEKGLDLERSDVNMIVTINPKTRKILLTSIPRDTYVMLHTAQQMDKLTHTGVYGVDETLNTVEDWLGVKFNYYVKMNFTACVGIINAMDGIDVESPMEFNPTKMPDWTVKKGMNHMTGRQALAFAREREAFGSEDSKRVENQQRVVRAVINKLTSSPVLLTKYGEILDAASSNMSTDMSARDMQTLVKMQLGDMGGWDIQTQKVIGDYEMDYVASLTQDQQFLVYKPRAESVREIVGNINAVMNPTDDEIRAAEEERKKNSVKNFFGRLFGRGNGEEQEQSEE